MTGNIKLGLVFTHHRAEAGDFMPYFNSVADILKLIGFTPAGDILVGAGMHELGQAERDHALMAKAYNTVVIYAAKNPILNNKTLKNRMKIRFFLFAGIIFFAETAREIEVAMSKHGCFLAHYRT